MFPLVLTVLDGDYSNPYYTLVSTVRTRGNIPTLSLLAVNNATSEVRSSKSPYAP